MGNIWRGLNDYQLKVAINQITGLNPLFDFVKGNRDYCIEIRDGYLCVYYKGGRILKISVSSIDYSFNFDIKYLNKRGATRNERVCKDDALRIWIEGKHSMTEWLAKFDVLKKMMDEWFIENPKEERDVQQRLLALNTFQNAGCQIVDIELAVPQELIPAGCNIRAKDYGRFDLIAVRCDGGKFVPIIIELKNGVNAFGTASESKDTFDNSSGLVGHYNKIGSFLTEERNRKFLGDCITHILQAKKEFGLITYDILPVETETVDVIFAVTNFNPDMDADAKKKARTEYKKLATKWEKDKSNRSFMTLFAQHSTSSGLSFQNAVPLDKYELCR